MTKPMLLLLLLMVFMVNLNIEFPDS